MYAAIGLTTCQESKQIVKNLLSGGEIWTLRIANNPLGELKVSPNSALRQWTFY